MKHAASAQIGRLGEDIACRFLVKRGFAIEGRNYWKKWGEIDIIAVKGGIYHFVEVKSVTREISLRANAGLEDEYRPEENVHPKKLERMRRVIQSYILEKRLETKEWQFDVLVVFLNISNREARCRFTEDVVL